TVTRSETAAGLSPASALPKLMFGFSREIERAPSMSMSAPALDDPVSSGGGPPAHEAVEVAEILGVGVAPVKSLSFASVSVHPPAPRASDVVFPRAGAPSDPAKSVGEPYPTRSTTFGSAEQLPAEPPHASAVV